MQLDRNINPDGRGKYALIKMRSIFALIRGQSENARAVRHALTTLHDAGIVDFGDSPDTDFFVIRLKDDNASAALSAYAQHCLQHGDEEFAREVNDLAAKAAAHPNRQQPD